MVREIIQLGDPKLSEVSQEIQATEKDSIDLVDLIADLKDTLKAYIDEAAGLSAVQLGYLKRVCVVVRYDLLAKRKDKKKDYQFEVMINPKVFSVDDSTSVEWEGCMSINIEGQKLYGPVTRPYRIRVEYLTQEFEKKSLIARGFFSHLIQHEVDHMNGKLFLSYISNPKNIWKEGEFSSYLDKYKDYPEII